MTHYDALETRDPEHREAEAMAALRAQVALARDDAPYYREALAGVSLDQIADRADLARLPLTRKSDLAARQEREPPFGGLVAVAPGDLARIYVSPGPIFDAEGHAVDYWQSARALFATGFRRGDVVQNCFSYHFTPAGMIFETGAHALGCAVIPAGVGNTELQARAIARVRPRGYVGTPDFLATVLETADGLGLDTGSIALAHVSGGPFLPPLQALYRDRGIDAYQSYGTADLGVVAYETEARDGLVVSEGMVVEIVRPGTGDPVPDGEVGEVVVTPLDNRHYPLIRFATGDLSAVAPGPSACGRTNMRIRGWMGRADQTTKIKGQFVHPAQLAEVLARHKEAGKGRLVVTAPEGRDEMLFRVEVALSGAAAEELAAAIAGTLQAMTKLRGRVEVVAPGTLPNDGKVIEDARDYD